MPRRADPPSDPDRFDEAVRAFRRLVPVTQSELEDLSEFEKRQAFTVANVTEARVVQQVYEAIDRAVDKGTTFEDFKDEVGGALAESWGGPDAPRMEAIFRTNTLRAYNDGRDEIFNSPAIKEARPYRRFDSAGDSRVCPICDPLDGTVMAADDPFWRTHRPPLHGSCFPPGTPILCPSGWHPIEALGTGAEVIAHDGKPRRVLRRFDRPFDGMLVAVLGPAGQVAYPTPNHPLAAEVGWVAAERLQVESDRLWVLQDKPAVPGYAPPIGNRNAFERAIKGGLLPRSVPLTPVELSDQPGLGYRNVCVITIDGQVHHMGNSELVQLIGYLALMAAARPSLGSARTSMAFFRAASASAGGHICRRHLSLLAGLVHAGIATGIVLGQGSEHTGRLEDFRDGDAAASVARGQRDRGLTRDIEADDFLLRESNHLWHPLILERASTGRIRYVGTVHNIEVDGSPTYVAGGILVHNCRCIHTPLSPEEADEEGVDDEPPDAEPPADGFGLSADYDPDWSSFPPEIARVLRERLEAGE